MRELSMHILDIAQNSIAAKATLIEIIVDENLVEDTLTIIVKDNGKGMDEEELMLVTNPFYTSRQTRKVGLGIPMFKAAAEACDGRFVIDSTLGRGTYVQAIFKHSHIDRVPLGNMVDTIVTLVASEATIDFVYKHSINEKKFVFDTREIKKILGDVPINNIDVIDWIRSYIKEGLDEIKI